MTSSAAASEPTADPFPVTAKAPVPQQPRSAAPSAFAEAPTGGADTRDMLVVHNALRREFRLMPDLVRRTHIGDVARAKVVADHLALVTQFLHHHHGGEDRLLWPVLLGRVDDSAAPVVLLMEAHHEAISAQLDVVEGLRPAFAANAGENEREELATACERLHVLLSEHLEAEESRILPLAARHVSPEQWGRMGEEGLGTIPKRQLPLAFGFLAYQADPDVFAGMIASAPRLARLLLPRLGRRAFARYAMRIHGTATP